MDIENLRIYLTHKRQMGRNIRKILCPRSPEGLANTLPFRLDTSREPNIILREDTFVELGPPDKASFNYLLILRDPNLIRDGLVTLCGPDIPDAGGMRLPIAQVLMVAGTGLTDENYFELNECQYIANRLPGYMIRFDTRRMWSRVSREAGKAGFSFETLGRNLMALYKTKFETVEAMEILFVTSADADVMELRNLLANRDSQPAQILKRKYDCAFSWGCEDCPYQATCDRIRKIAEARNRMS